MRKLILKWKTWFSGPPAPLPARRAYRPEGRSYGSESQVRDRGLCETKSPLGITKAGSFGPGFLPINP